MPIPPSRLTWAETRRKLAHMAAFWPALFLPWMSPPQAMGVTFLLLLMNLFVLPWAARGLYRAEENGMGALEIILYPAALMACVAAFGRPSPAWYLPVGAAWFALAFVDAGIGFACRILPGGPVLPWNSRKPVAAVLLGALASSLPAFALANWALPSMPLFPPMHAGGWAVLAILLLAAVGAETAWFGVADNLVIPFTVCVLIPLVPNPLMASAGFPVSAPWWYFAAPLGFGVSAYAGKLLTLGGAVLGALLALILILANPWLFLFLGGFFALGNFATRFGSDRKRALGIAEARGGRRGAAEVFGAMGVAAWMTPLAHVTDRMGPPAGGRNGIEAALLVCIAPLIAKTMDTVSSEMGKALGGRTISLRTFRAVPPGTEGGVSLAGTLCGLAAAAFLSAAVLPLRWGGWPAALALCGIAVLANVFESYWGEYAARRGMDQGPHTNVLMTLAAAVAAWLLWFAL
jgi:uncharacterized protein (TIGR00297 family)